MNQVPAPEPQQDAPVDLAIDGEVALLVDLLKLGTFIGTPMREGVAAPLGLTTTDLRRGTGGARPV